MINKKTSALGPVKRITFSVMAAIALILVSYVLLHSYDRHRSFDDKIIINVFGKQRMYTQLISKDASSLYILMLENEKEKPLNSKKEIHKQILAIKKNMDEARRAFSNTLEAIHNKHIKYEHYMVHMNSTAIDKSEYLKKIDDYWIKFNSALVVINTAGTTSSELLNAINYINNNNVTMLDLTDKLLKELLNESIRIDRVTEIVEYGLLVLLLILLSIYLYNLLRFIILPYNQLYKGITEIGLLSYPATQRFPTRKRVLPLVAEVNSMFLKIDNLISLIENINNNDSFMNTLTYISKTFSVFIPYSYIGVALISDDKKTLKATYGVSDGSVIGLPEKVMGAHWTVDDTSLGSLLETGEARIINDLEEYCSGKPVKPYNKVILEAGIKASIALPLKVSGEPVGIIFFSSINKNVYTNEHLHFLNTLANSIAISLNQNIFASNMQYSSILALAKLSEARDENTGEHMERMTIYSRTIAQFLHNSDSFSEEITLEYIDLIERFSPLHDIGKVGIADGILLKPAKLTPEEFDEMKKHTVFGAQVLKSADLKMRKKGKSLYGMGVEIAEGHHEKWDGNGYPYGKKGKEIPLSARIVAIADVFDALSSKRPYKEALSFEQSFQIILDGSGSHFDPEIVILLKNNRKHFEEIYKKYRQ